MRVLSGVQPTGKLHIGNYFGAIRQYVALQSEHDGFYFMANYHALTTIHDGPTLRQQTNEIAADFLALGLDPAQATIFRQSDVPEVCELTWVLSTICPMGLLERCHAYKDKVQQGLTADHGLFAYPVLMAADILIYNSHLVPVGQDQKQHIEVTRDLAIRFNNQYGDILTVPDGYILETTAIVPGLDGRKMSKSYDNTIGIFEPDKSVKKKIMSIVTDSTPVEAPKDPDNNTIFQLYSLFATPEQKAEMAQSYRAGGVGYGEYKKQLLAAFLEYFGTMRERRAALEQDMGTVEDVLAEGARKARAVARETLDKVRAAVGV
ncbi:tryptophan--tRNA ligase [bacterium]|nr:tryptophan--tRNA ligase [bacterium]